MDQRKKDKIGFYVVCFLVIAMDALMPFIIKWLGWAKQLERMVNDGMDQRKR